MARELLGDRSADPGRGAGDRDYLSLSHLATLERSSTNWSMAASRSSSSARRIADGCVVSVTSSARSESSGRPRSRPTRIWRAEQRLSGGRAEAHQRNRLDHRELGLQPRQAGAHVPAVGLLMDPALSAGLVAEVLDDVGDVGVVGIDPGALQALVQDPARRADERVPSMSSRSPGCSPTSITVAPRLPSPMTAWVAPSHRSQARHSWTALRMFVRLGFAGTGAGGRSSVCCACVLISSMNVLPEP